VTYFRRAQHRTEQAAKARTWQDSDMFKLLGALLAMYVIYCVLRGETFAKQGPWGRTLRRDEGAARFRAVIGVYVLLSAALMFYF
jgi:hypothetical protein